MYNGRVIKKLTKAGTLNKKPDNMTLILFSDQKDKKLSKDVCKIMVYELFFLFKNVFVLLVQLSKGM